MKVDAYPLDIDVLDKQLKAFEAEYHVPSSQLATAFTVGPELRETEDFRDWSFAYSTWQAIQRINAKR